MPPIYPISDSDHSNQNKGSHKPKDKHKFNGTAGRARTDTLLLARDFESRVSTNSTTAANYVIIPHMASELDTLNIGSIRLRKEFPVADVQSAQGQRLFEPANHPVAAEAARARIAALPERHPLPHPETVPATPTADLITDKATLAKQAKAEPIVTGPKIPSALQPLVMAIGIFALVLLLFKAPVVLSQLGYSLGSKPAPAANIPPIAASEVVPAANTLSIPKINIQAPVIYEPSVKEADVQRALQSGVVHYGNTAAPGQTGNVALFGHSSNDWWEPGNFKFVFVLLDKLAPGDRITMDYNSQRFVYEVTGSRIVEPTAVDVLNPTAEPTLTLITCTPPGTSLRRLVVTAKQVSPDPHHATVAQTAPAAGSGNSLPSSAPGFFTQIQTAWNGVVHGFKSLFGGDNAGPAVTGDGQLPAIK
ncbi:MAG: putative sortase [Patescibacteria group bacterium]|nr:putative sortase [Patescibacteria group bacterium]